MSQFNQNNAFTYTTSDGDYEFGVVPKGSDQTEQSIKRSTKSDGMILNVIQNLEFVKGVRSLIITEWYKKGVDMLFKVTKKEKYYNDFFVFDSGYLLGKTLSWDKTSATADFVDNDFDAVFRDNHKKKFELERLTDINGNAIAALTREQMAWKTRRIYRNTYLKQEDSQPDTGSSVPEFIVTPKMVIQHESDDTIQSVLDSSVFSAAHTDDVSSANCFLLNNERPKQLTINFKADITTTSYDTAQVRLYRYTGYPTFTGLVNETNIGPVIDSGTAGLNFSVDETFTVEVATGESLVIGVWIDLTGIFDFSVQANSASLQIEEDSNYVPIRPEDRFVDVISLKDAIKRTIEIMDPNVEFISSILDDTWPNLVVTGGETIRHVEYTQDDFEINNQATLLTTSFEKLYKALYAITPVAYTITSSASGVKFYLEDISYVFDREIAVDLGPLEVDKYSVDDDRTYGSVKIGWSKTGESDEIFGLQAVNTVNTYQLPSTTSEQIYDAISDFISDPNWAQLCYEKQFADNPDKNHKNDKDIFIFDCVKNGDIYTPAEYTQHFSSVEGVYDVDSVFNVRLSPMNCAVRHAKNFKQEYTKPVYSGKSMVFSSTEGNKFLKSTLIGGSQLEEGGSVLLSDMDDPMYTNLKIEASRSFTKPIRDAINKNDGKPNYLKTQTWTDKNGNQNKAFFRDVAIGEKIQVELMQRYN